MPDVARVSAVVFGTGTVVLGLLGSYPKDAFVVEGYDVVGNLIVHPLRGGFPYKMNDRQAARLREVSSPGMPRTFRCGRFALEGVDESFEGWTDGQLDHGWATPHFELAEALRLMARLNGRHDEAARLFSTKQGEVREIWKARDIKTEHGKRLEVFPIGAGKWHWTRREAELLKR
jgi:hypothetical protein